MVYSQLRSEKEAMGWYRDGKNIRYFANGLKSQSKPFYTLTFTLDFKYSYDTVLIAYSHPYTYTDLTEYLSRIESDDKISEFCIRKTLCRTIAGNKCEYLTIMERSKEVTVENRKCVVISARVHPGETVGSWMMKGVIDFLTDLSDPEAKLLRKNFIFKIIPMLNPDGVINGNYRCSLAGCDLNRRWKNPSKILHPTIYYAKKMIINLAKERKMALFCDLHGHSKKKDVFMYGCNYNDNPAKTRVFPLILSKLCPLFSFKKSRYLIEIR